MNKIKFTQQILSQLRKKKLLKESPEGESNAITTTLQNCVEVLSGLPESLQTILDSTVSSEDIDILEKTISAIEYVNKQLNDSITNHTAGLTEDMNKDGAVNMTVDNLIKEPEVFKKLSDKDINVDVIDQNGKNLAEAFSKEKQKEIKSTFDRPKLKSIQVKIRKILSEISGKDLTGVQIFTEYNKDYLRYKFFTRFNLDLEKLQSKLNQSIPGVKVKKPNGNKSYYGNGLNFYIPYSLFQLDSNSSTTNSLSADSNEGKNNLSKNKDFDYETGEWKNKKSSSEDHLGNVFAESRKRKIVKETLAELKKKGLLNLKESIESDELERLFDELVPSSGQSETIEGEIVRAINRVWYRYNNDGDFYFKGYGLETAAPSVKYLLKSPIGSKLKPIFSSMRSGVSKMPKRDKYGNFTGQFTNSDPYLQGLEQVGKIIVAYVKSKQGKYSPNTNDSR